MVKTPLFPLYSRTQKLIQVLSSKRASTFKAMWDRIMELKGTPQDPTDWQDPDKWIYERLSGEGQNLAKEIWESSNKTVNPRHLAGIQFLIKGYNLMAIDSDVYRITEKGKIFVSNADNEVMREIDISEGCIFILSMVSLYNESTRKNFVADWTDYLLTNSNYRKESIIKDSLRRRLVNLIDRNYLKREGNVYEITEKGLKYLSSFKEVEIQNIPKKGLSEVVELNKEVEKFISKQKEYLRKKLSEMSSQQFEYLVSDLLEALGYEDIVVTSLTNDKGVDVTGVIENGITSIKEVIQVKKLSSNVQRTVLDSLRGSLHRFDAVKGTIITLSDFSKGAKEAAFEKGAAPITLINGNKLIELLIQNEIAVKKKAITTFTVDSDYFNESEEAEVE